MCYSASNLCYSASNLRILHSTSAILHLICAIQLTNVVIFKVVFVVQAAEAVGFSGSFRFRAADDADGYDHEKDCKTCEMKYKGFGTY